LYSIKKSNKTKIAGIGLCVLIVLLAGLYYLGASMTKPERTAEKFYSSISSGNYAAAFDMINYPVSEFVNADQYGKYISNEAMQGYGGLIVNSVIENRPGTDFSKTYNVAFTAQGSDYMEEITLVSTGKKAFLLFPKWKVDVNSGTPLIAPVEEDWNIYVPNGSELYLDGLLIDRENAVEQVSELTGWDADFSETPNRDTIFEKYVLRNIMANEYEIKATIPGGTDSVITGYPGTDSGIAYFEPDNDMAKELETRIVAYVKDWLKAKNSMDFKYVKDYYIEGTDNYMEEKTYFTELSDTYSMINDVLNDYKVNNIYLDDAEHARVETEETYTTSSTGTDGYIYDNGDVDTFQWMYHLQREGDSWKVMEAELLNPWGNIF